MHIEVIISYIAEIAKIVVAFGNIATVILVVMKFIDDKRKNNRPTAQSSAVILYVIE